MPDDELTTNALMSRQLDSLDKTTKLEVSRHRWSIVFKLLVFVYVSFFFVMLALQGVLKMGSTEDHVAIVRVSGPIMEDQKANAGSINTSLRDAFEEKSAKAVILAINSPGGSPVQSSYIYDEIIRLKTLHPDKPVYAVISDVGASGAYFIASAADEIYANPSSLVGSIGVTAASFGFTGTMDKLGVERRQFTAGKHKAFLDPFSPIKKDEVVFWEGVLSNVHQNFVSAVKAGRGDRLVLSDDLFSGLIWDGNQALEMGLIDGFGSARAIARDKHDQDILLDYSGKDFLGGLVSKLGVSAGEGIAAKMGLNATAAFEPVLH